MAKLTEADALKLVAAAASLVTQLGTLIPQLVENFQRIKDGLEGEDSDELNAQIVATHDEVQALDAKLQALKA